MCVCHQAALEASEDPLGEEEAGDADFLGEPEKPKKKRKTKEKKDPNVSEKRGRIQMQGKRNPYTGYVMQSDLFKRMERKGTML